MILILEKGVTSYVFHPYFAISEKLYMDPI